MGDEHRTTIRILKDGPYVLDGPVPIVPQTIVTDGAGEAVAWRAGEPLPAKRSCSLCRCGESGVKPYCDGSHRTTGFVGTETASDVPYEDAATVIVGPALRLLDDITLCAEARFCAAKGTIWHRIERDDEESRGIVVDGASLCPSGRYTAVDADGRAHEPDLEPSVGLVEDPSVGVSGPLWIRGGIPVISSDGTAYEVRNRVTLCRCGGSKNMPFCDATHVEIGFDASE